MSYIEFKNVDKKYQMGEITIDALSNTNFQIEKGELVVIVGPSGARKNNHTKHTSEEWTQPHQEAYLLTVKT